MDIVIGESARIGPADQYMRDGNLPFSMEAKFLEIKEKKEQGGAGMQPRGRVLSVLIPENQRIPRGLESGEYRIFLRLVPRHQPRY